MGRFDVQLFFMKTLRSRKRKTLCFSAHSKKVLNACELTQSDHHRKLVVAHSSLKREEFLIHTGC